MIRRRIELLFVETVLVACAFAGVWALKKLGELTDEESPADVKKPP